MGFKKIILVLPAEGYTGKTIAHIVTKTNLKNQPELVEKGIKDGDTIQIIEPVVDPPIVGDSAATKTKSTAKDKEVKVRKPASDEEIPSVGKGNAKRAKEIADAQSVDVVFENENGEFFTSENLVRLSVGNDKTKIITHTF